MKNSIVIKYLKSFSKNELNQLEKFLLSPFYNTNKINQTLFNSIKKYYPDFPENKINKELLFKKINPGKKYDDTLMRKYISNFKKVIEEFVEVISFQNMKKPEKKLMVLRHLAENDMRELYEKYLQANFNEKKDKDIIDKDYLNFNYRLEANKNSFRANYNIKGELLNSLPASGNFLTLDYLLKSLLFLNEFNGGIKNFNFKTEQSITNTLFDFIDVEKYLLKMKEQQYDFLWLVEIIFGLLKLLRDDRTDSRYSEVKQKISENLHKIDNEFYFKIIHVLFEYGIEQTIKGRTDFDEEIFELTKIVLEIIDPKKFMNVVYYRIFYSIAIRLRELDWANHFVDKYTGYLPVENQSNLYNFSMGIIEFYRNNFSKALEYLSKVENDYEMLKYVIKIPMLQIYFELGYYDECLYLIDNIKHFCKAEKNGVYKNAIEYIKTFVQYYSQLVNFQNSKINIDDLKMIKKKYDTENNFKDIWLTEKFLKFTELK